MLKPNPSFIDDDDSDIFNDFLNNNLEPLNMEAFDFSAFKKDSQMERRMSVEQWDDSSKD